MRSEGDTIKEVQQENFADCQTSLEMSPFCLDKNVAFLSSIKMSPLGGGKSLALEAGGAGTGGEAESGVEEFFEEEVGEATSIVAQDAVFLEEIVEDDAEAELLEGGKIDGHRFGALGAVAPGHIGRDGLAIGDDPI